MDAPVCDPHGHFASQRTERDHARRLPICSSAVSVGRQRRQDLRVSGFGDGPVRTDRPPDPRRRLAHVGRHLIHLDVLGPRYELTRCGLSPLGVVADHPWLCRCRRVCRATARIHGGRFGSVQRHPADNLSAIHVQRVFAARDPRGAARGASGLAAIGSRVRHSAPPNRLARRP